MDRYRDQKQKANDNSKKAIREVEQHHDLIRHHLEEATTHLGMVKQLVKEDQDPKLAVEVQEARLVKLSTIGKYLKKLYILHGGHPDA